MTLKNMPNNSSKNILVSGGAGFLGSHLCKKLLDAGNQIFCLDNLETGSLANIDSLSLNKKFHFINADIIDPIKIEEDLDEIYNLACPASPINYQKDPVRTNKTSVIGILNILDLAIHHDAMIFHASTSEVYGNPLMHPQKESYWGNVNPIGPRACYDEGKRCAETLCFDYMRQYGAKIKVVRIFNTYGPNMQLNDGRVVSNFIVQALNNNPITVYGAGKQTRSFCYVSDLIEAFLSMMGSQKSFHGPVNIGNPVEFTMLELAQKVIALTKSSSQIIFQPLPQDDPEKRKPDITLARQELNWEPKISLEDGLIETIKFFKTQLLIK
jgi:UDP-glucuronate decarboxylase